MPEPILAVSGLRAGYGTTEILRGVDLVVGHGEIVAVSRHPDWNETEYARSWG